MKPAGPSAAGFGSQPCACGERGREECCCCCCCCDGDGDRGWRRARRGWRRWSGVVEKQQQQQELGQEEEERERGQSSGEWRARRAGFCWWWGRLHRRACGQSAPSTPQAACHQTDSLHKSKVTRHGPHSSPFKPPGSLLFPPAFSLSDTQTCSSIITKEKETLSLPSTFPPAHHSSSSCSPHRRPSTTPSAP